MTSSAKKTKKSDTINPLAINYYIMILSVKLVTSLLEVTNHHQLPMVMERGKFLTLATQKISTKSTVL